MIIYTNDKHGFLADIPHIANILKDRISSKLGEMSSESEIRSWENSLRHMANVISDEAIPDDSGIALEYNIPVTNNRIDFMITGNNAEGKQEVVMVELKQWQHVLLTDKDGVVKTHYEDGMKETTHPSYQVISYASLLYDFIEAVHDRKVYLHPCAYLHNYEDAEGQINDARYEKYTNRAPVFCKNDVGKLREFIKTYIFKGDRDKSLYTIENSTIAPSKSLIDSVVRMAEGKREFNMIDEQKVVYQNALWAYEKHLRTRKKQVIIVEGGPGTGKSVIAIQLLVAMTRQGKLAHYITKNASPRNVLYSKFMGVDGVHSTIKNLFKSSGTYVSATNNSFDMLIADEAHRLQEHSGRYSNLGENQIKEIIHASKVGIFFIDRHQIVDLKDIGSVEEIEKWAHHFGADIIHMKLHSQFRCSGSDEYLNWLDHLLQYDAKLPIHFSGSTYDFQVMDSPTEVMKAIKEKNRYRHKSRVVAGYCWPWKSRKNQREKDIVFPEYGFAYKWNLAEDKTWCISAGSVDQIGCIHTSQGLEFDYVGVIIGEDIICRDGKILVQPNKRATDDMTVRGWRKLIETSEGKDRVKSIIKNTYKTLMTRGMKGCYVYVCDEELRNYIKEYLQWNG